MGIRFYMAEDGVVEKVASLAVPALEEMGMELVSLEYRKEGERLGPRLYRQGTAELRLTTALMQAEW